MVNLIKKKKYINPTEKMKNEKKINNSIKKIKK
jgi:hypothetical protein